MSPETETALPTLRLLTCGSVDDGKSTLIGRLLYEKKLIFDDQLSALERDSKKFGTTGDRIDYALLVDGLEAEREQGITIDVAYRYFATARRSFIVADTPGHEQYTRNMATGASNADLAIVLVDARKGLLTQTHRHSIIVSLLGVRHVALAVNKIDLVGFSETAFRQIEADYRKFAETLGFRSLIALPISARYGDNVSSLSARTPWYEGPHLLDYLERVEVEEDRRSAPFRLPVQWINRPHHDFRGFSGTIPSGRVARGDAIAAADSGRQSTVARLLIGDREVEAAEAGDAVTLTLADEIDIARGDVLAKPDSRPEVADQFTAHIIWMSAEPMLPGRSYLLKIGGRHDARVGHRAQAPSRRQQFRQAGGQASRSQRSRLLQHRDHDAGRVRRLRRQSRHRRLHPHRSRDQRDCGGGDDRARAEARDQRASARARGRPRGARGAQASEAGDPMVHRAVGGGKIDHRQPGRGQASCAGRAYRASRRRQRPPRPQQGLRVSPPTTGSRTSAASARWRD